MDSITILLSQYMEWFVLTVLAIFSVYYLCLKVRGPHNSPVISTGSVARTAKEVDQKSQLQDDGKKDDTDSNEDHDKTVPDFLSDTSSSSVVSDATSERTNEKGVATPFDMEPTLVKSSNSHSEILNEKENIVLVKHSLPVIEKDTPDHNESIQHPKPHLSTPPFSHCDQTAPKEMNTTTENNEVSDIQHIQKSSSRSRKSEDKVMVEEQQQQQTTSSSDHREDEIIRAVTNNTSDAAKQVITTTTRSVIVGLDMDKLQAILDADNGANIHDNNEKRDDNDNASVPTEQDDTVVGVIHKETAHHTENTGRVPADILDNQRDEKGSSDEIPSKGEGEKTVPEIDTTYIDATIQQQQQQASERLSPIQQEDIEADHADLVEQVSLNGGSTAKTVGTDLIKADEVAHLDNSIEEGKETSTNISFEHQELDQEDTLVSNSTATIKNEYTAKIVKEETSINSLVSEICRLDKQSQTNKSKQDMTRLERIDQQRQPYIPLYKSRCEFWPGCTNNHCKYYHPFIECRNGKDCTFGKKCIFLHPKDLLDFQKLKQAGELKKKSKKNAKSSKLETRTVHNAANKQQPPESIQRGLIEKNSIL